MSKNKIRGYIVLAVLAALLSITAFAAPFQRGAVFWLGYGFGMFAVLFQIVVFKLAFSASGDTKSNFYGFPIATTGTTYLVLQLIVSVAEMALSSGMAVWIAVLLNAILLASAVISCIGADIQRDETVRQDENNIQKTSVMKSLIASAAALADLAADGETVKILQKVGEKFRFSDPVSSAATQQLEERMKLKIDGIKQALADGKNDEVRELCSGLLTDLSERNRICAQNK